MRAVSRREWIIRLALIVLAAGVAHGLCLWNPWYLDDQLHLFKNMNLLDGTWENARLRRWTYFVWVHWKQWFGLDPLPFHALNLTLHAGISVAVFFLAKRLYAFRSGADERDGIVFAFWSALVFAVHPAGSEVPHYAAQTTIQWVTLFLVLSGISTLGFLRRPNWVSPLLVAVWTFLGIFSKEAGIFHIGMVVGLILVVLAPWKELVVLARKRKGLVLGVALLAVAIGTVAVIEGKWHIRAQRALTAENLDEHMLTQSRVFWMYMQRIVVPVGLCSDHFLPSSVDGGDRVAVLGAIGLIGLSAATAFGLFRRWRIPALCLALALAPLLLRFLYPVAEHMVEYRLYPAMPFFAMLIAFGLLALSRWSKLPAARRFIPHAAVVVMIGLSIWRGTDWRTPQSIGENVLARYPNHMRIHSYLQWHELDNGELEAAIRRQNKMVQSLQDIFSYNRRADEHHRRYDVGKVLGAYVSGEQLTVLALVNLGKPKEAIQRVTAVIERLKRVNRGNDMTNGFGILYRARGQALLSVNRKDLARADFVRALERNPKDVNARNLLAKVGPPQQAPAPAE